MLSPNRLVWPLLKRSVAAATLGINPRALFLRRARLKRKHIAHLNIELDSMAINGSEFWKLGRALDAVLPLRVYNGGTEIALHCVLSRSRRLAAATLWGDILKQRTLPHGAGVCDFAMSSPTQGPGCQPGAWESESPRARDDGACKLFRLPVMPSERNGLKEPSSLMVDKLTTVPKAKLGKRIGSLDEEGHRASEPSHHGISRPRRGGF
jgi:hypothetical protein